jgi:hypothetical protein
MKMDMIGITGLTVVYVCAFLTDVKLFAVGMCVVMLVAYILLHDEHKEPAKMSTPAKGVSSKKSSLKSTPNPNAQGSQLQTSPAANEGAKAKEATQETREVLVTAPTEIQWDNDGKHFFEHEMRKRDEYIFKHELHRQPSDSRARFLKSLYQELEESNVKRDPFLHPSGDETECSRLRGRGTSKRNWSHM